MAARRACEHSGIQGPAPERTIGCEHEEASLALQQGHAACTGQLQWRAAPPEGPARQALTHNAHMTSCQRHHHLWPRDVWEVWGKGGGHITQGQHGPSVEAINQMEGRQHALLF